jgi:cell division protein FtsI (penicillin-binding protein 3)
LTHPASNQRIVLLALFLGGCLAAVVVRLAWLQVIDSSHLKGLATRQAQVHQDLPARRGSILDRNGEALAEDVVMETVMANGRQAKDPQALARDLSSSLHVNYPATLARLRQGRCFVVKRNAPQMETAALKKQRWDALSFFPRYTRVYPQGRLACHVLGYVGADGHGQEGLELQYDKVLQGQPGSMRAARDARGVALVSDNVIERAPVSGSDLVLTLDTRLQHIAERELAKAYVKYHPHWAGLVALDPQNGEVLAMATLPDYDPNHPGDFPVESRRNRVVTDAYEPGSTFKLVTASMALEQGVLTPDTPVDCQHGHANFLGRAVRDHEDLLGVVPFRETFIQSSNIGMVTAALKVGPQKMYEGARRFGFGDRTGIDLPGETPGLLRPLKDWSGISLAAIAFGQELSCNLLRVACAYAPIANGGSSVTPHLYKEQRGGGLFPSGGPSRPFSHQVVGDRVRREVGDMMLGVVDHGTGTPAALPGFLVAGKTGTAEKYDRALRRYNYNKNSGSFVGFVPADHPRLLMAVVLDEPHGLTLGGWVSGPVFREAASGMLATLGVAPNAQLAQGGGRAQAGVPCVPGRKPVGRPHTGLAPNAIAEVPVPDLQGLVGAAAQQRLKAAGLRCRARGLGGVVVSQVPMAGTLVSGMSTVSYLLRPAKAGARLAAN